jgi:TonB family protein
VLVEAAIGPTGKVEKAKVKRSNQPFDQAALDVVRQWEFTPTIYKGTARSVLMSITVNFRMQ